MTSTTRSRLEFAVILAVAIGLVLATFRAGRLLTFDGYHYCELAKLFAVEWPDRFGNHWPFGWPLAGGLLARLGLPGYEALVVCAVISLAFILAGSTRVLAAHPLRAVVLTALASAPIIAPQVGSVLTELPFAAALLGLALCLTAWPTRGALWGAAACAVAALSLRYAGLIALAIIATWIVAQWRPLSAAGRAREAVVAACVACAVSIALLGINVLKSGHLSGAGRGNPPGLSGLPAQLVDFGWSLPSALIAGGLRDRIGPYTPVGIVVGAVCFGAITAVCVWAWLRPRSAFSRPLALTALAYCSGMAVLRCIGEFDALHNARTFLPALFPLGLLVAEAFSGYRTILALASLGLFTTGFIAAARGISREIGGDVHPVVSVLRTKLQPADTIAINDQAFALGAYLPQRTRHLWAQSSEDFPLHRFLVVAAEPSARDGTGGTLTADWLATTKRLVATGNYAYLVRAPDLVALERTLPIQPPVRP